MKKLKEMVKIRFLKSAVRIGYSYLKGQEVSCSEAFADEMAELGMAKRLSKKAVMLPENFPMRHVLNQHGIETLDELNRFDSVEMLTELKGIGKRSAQAILDRLRGGNEIHL